MTDFFLNVGPPKENIFSGHLSPIFQSTFTHNNYKFMPWCDLRNFQHLIEEQFNIEIQTIF